MTEDIEIQSDLGARLAKRLSEQLSDLDFPKEASSALERDLRDKRHSPLAPTFFRYELPSDVEELLTLRNDRFELFVSMGVHENGRGELTGFVLLAMPLMGWEILDMLEARSSEGSEDGSNMDMGDPASLIDFYLGQVSDLNNDIRLFLPILATTLDDFEDKEGYDLRKVALRITIKLLCTHHAFKVHFGQNGIPKEILDDWIDGSVLEAYNEKFRVLKRSLEKDEKNADAHFEMAGLMLSRDRCEEAIISLRKAMDIEPEYPPFYFALADALARSGHEEEADEVEEKGLAIQRDVGLPPSKADLYTFLNPFIYRSDDIGPNTTKEVRQGPCVSCGYDFLYFLEDGAYKCNRCGFEPRS